MNISKVKLMNVEIKTLLFVAAILFLTIASGCGVREKEIPGINVVGIRTSINRILTSPIAFDAAIVAVEGIARSVSEVSEGREQKITQFRLSDIRGNFINVSIQGEWSILEDDTLIVGGIYRRDKNEIEAQQIEKIELKK